MPAVAAVVVVEAGRGPLVEPGVYLVTVRFNGREYRQTVRVEAPSQTSALSGGWQ